VIRRYAARVILLDGGGRTLLFHWANRDRGTDWWATPGGGIEKGERAVEAARRELREECGVETADIEGPAWRAEHFYRSGPDLFLQAESFFIARVAGDRPEIDVEGLDQYETSSYLGHRWWSLDELEGTADRVFPDDLPDRLRRLERGDPMPADESRGRGGRGRGRRTAPSI
jgi:8-oxo-dGTP pyrophosphatase MutT (NUDIX family)